MHLFACMALRFKNVKQPNKCYVSLCSVDTEIFPHEFNDTIVHYSRVIVLRFKNSKQTNDYACLADLPTDLTSNSRSILLWDLTPVLFFLWGFRRGLPVATISCCYIRDLPVVTIWTTSHSRSLFFTRSKAVCDCYLLIRSHSQSIFYEIRLALRFLGLNEVSFMIYVFMRVHSLSTGCYFSMGSYPRSISLYPLLCCPLSQKILNSYNFAKMSFKKLSLYV
jgi:hypothetical protein